MKHKKLIAAFLAAAMAVTCLPQAAIAEPVPQEAEPLAAGDTGTYQDFNYEELEDGTLAITGYNGSAAELVIPSEIDGKKVTVIGDSAFLLNESITKVTIPDSVTTIEAYAFQWCHSLTKITLPDSVTTIGDSAFSDCGSLAEINLPDSLTTIEQNAFERCTSLTEITIPNSVTTIGSYAFYNCHSLTEITIPNSLTTIGPIFIGCGSLTEITIPEGVTTLEGTFGNCGLTKVNLPDSLTTIGDWTFAQCRSLEEINIPNSVTSIGDNAFFGCSSLKEINLPDSLTSIGKEAFRWCNSLAAINAGKNNKNFSSIDGILFNKDLTTLILFPRGKAVTSYVVPDGVTTIGYDAFDSCTTLTEITIPDSVTSLGSEAFEACTSLTKVNLSNSITSIQYGTFSHCSSLPEINIPDSVQTIDDWAFYSCSSLQKIMISPYVTKIAERSAFYYCHDDLTIYGYTGSYAETYANTEKIPFVSLGLFLNSDSDVSVTADTGVIPDDTQLEVKQTEKTDTSVSYNITLIQDGKEVQPDGKVTVRIPVPYGWGNSKIHVYHKDADGTLTDMNAVVSGGYIIFTTDHFSEYVIERETILPGDVNNDGEVGELDSVELARYLANWNVTIDKDAADLDGDGEVGETDSVILARRLAGWNV